MHQIRNERFVDSNPTETQEWLESLDQLIDEGGPDRVRFLMEQLSEHARNSGAELPVHFNTPYINTIRVEDEVPYPGDRAMERRIKSLIRWNAMAMVVRQNKYDHGIGGHISTYASLATLLEVGFNHFFHAKYGEEPGDLIYFQGHASPGVYARAFLEGRLTEEHLMNFRHELRGGPGLPSYPHPWLMPDFWRFPTVSMGLGPLNAIYQARFMRYLENRGLIPTTPRKIWAYLGDGEMDEPESMGSLTLASREKLDNLIFVINCNLQRLDGPVRGNGKIIQELEAAFRGAGWNVIKLIWGGDWDELLRRDTTGLLETRMNEVVDGELQTYVTKDGAYVRKNFFGKYPELLDLVSHLSDDQLLKLKRGGHDPKKVYNAYKTAVETTGQPTVILAHTVKGYGLGEAGEGRNITHQQKKLNEAEMMEFRSRFEIPIPEEAVHNASFCRPPADSPEISYMHERRRQLGGYVPYRQVPEPTLKAPPLEYFKVSLEGSQQGNDPSSTMAFVKVLTLLMKHPELGKRVVPIIPDEARTFGMESLFRQFGIYASQGQLYKPHDAEVFLYYKESKDGQILEEGITEAGSMASFTAAGTAAVNYGKEMIPFFIYYSMFGFQRVGDMIWAFGDARGKGLPLRRHGRAHHPLGRGAPASGRPQRGAGQHRPDLYDVRSGVRLRDRDHRAGWHPAHVPGTRGPLLLPHPIQRKLSHAADAGGFESRRCDQGDLPLPPSRQRQGSSAAFRQRPDPQRGAQGPADPGGKIWGRGRRLERHQLWRVAPGSPGDGAMESAAPGRARTPAAHRTGPGGRGRTDYRGQRLYESGGRPVVAVAAGPPGNAGHRWIRPQREPRASEKAFRDQRRIHRRRRAFAPGARGQIRRGEGNRRVCRIGRRHRKGRPGAGLTRVGCLNAIRPARRGVRDGGLRRAVRG